MQRLMISFLTIALLLAIVPDSQMQEQEPKLPRGKKPRTECGTVVTAKQVRVERERLARGGYARLAPQVNRPYHIPLTIHIVRLDDGTGGFSLDNLQTAMQDLNRMWLPVGIQFYQRGEVDYINSTYHSFVPDSEARRNELRAVNPVAFAINVYFTDLDNLCGQSTFTTSSPQGVLMNNGCAGIGNSPSTFAHEIGHYFDLYHTHETAFGADCPGGGSCSSAGDLLCDTAADPELNYEDDVTAACVWTGSPNPNNCLGSTYNPPTRNLMSYSRRTCRDRFTDDQTSKVLSILNGAANRFILINTAKYVAPDGSLNSNCTYQSPCRTLARAVAVANPGDLIFLLSGTYAETTTVNKAVFLKKWNTDAGTVIIGQ